MQNFILSWNCVLCLELFNHRPLCCGYCSITICFSCLKQYQDHKNIRSLEPIESIFKKNGTAKKIVKCKVRGSGSKSIHAPTKCPHCKKTTIFYCLKKKLFSKYFKLNHNNFAIQKTGNFTIGNQYNLNFTISTIEQQQLDTIKHSNIYSTPLSDAYDDFMYPLNEPGILFIPNTNLDINTDIIVSDSQSPQTDNQNLILNIIFNNP